MPPPGVRPVCRHEECISVQVKGARIRDAAEAAMLGTILMLIGTAISILVNLDFIRPVRHNNPFGL